MAQALANRESSRASTPLEAFQRQDRVSDLGSEHCIHITMIFFASLVIAAGFVGLYGD